MATTTARSIRVSTMRGEVETQVQVAGSGPPLVYLHAAFGLVWDEFLDALRQEYTIYAPAHPGTAPGAPDAIKAIDDVWDLVLHYYDLFDQLGLASPVVVGHSFGGMIAAEVAATNPGRVSQLTLISPLGLWRDDLPVAQFMTMSREQVASALYLDPLGPAATRSRALPEDAEEAVQSMLRTMWSQACAGKFMWPLPDRGLHKRLHRITAPTLIVWGEQDRLVPAAYADEFAERIAHAEVHRVDRAAHVPQLERLDEVTEAVQTFLASRP